MTGAQQTHLFPTLILEPIFQSGGGYAGKKSGERRFEKVESPLPIELFNVIFLILHPKEETGFESAFSMDFRCVHFLGVEFLNSLYFLV